MSARAPSVLACGAMVAGRYRIESLLGRGGTAEVYRAHDVAHARDVALKRLLADRDAHPSVAFEREYYTLTQLRHPHIVAAYDFGYDDTTPFYTMELLHGDDLRALAPMPWPRACEVLSDVASALALVHSRRTIHGDVSARNVRCAATGKATLIDFGTMSTMGAPGHLIGTPPHVAPELGTGQPVDERTDLYALGTLAYWLLTGTHAYPVRTLQELTAAWRSTPMPLRRRADVPDALAELVTSLIEPDPIARPGGAAEVLDRLTAIAQLAAREQPATARAYLASPPLIDRQPQLDRIVAAVTDASEGRGSALLVRGEAGTGSSRLLREFVLRAKTAGATVLSTAADRDRGAFGVARVLARQLLARGGPQATAAAQPHKHILGGLDGTIPELEGGEALASLPIERRAQLATALRDWFAAVAAEQFLAVAVADLDRCDDASVSFLAALAAHAPGVHLVVATTAVDTGAPDIAGLAGLHRHSEVIELGPLDRAGTRALVRSMFGRVPHVERLAEITHDLCQGNALLSLELARHLVSRDAVHYRDGAWSIPRDLTVADVPSSLADWLEARVAALDEPARGLAELLAVRGAALTVAECVALSEQPAPAVFAALDRLTMARIVVVAGAKVSLAQTGLRHALLAGLPDERRRALHGRVGRALAAGEFDDELRRLEAGYHLLQSGDAATGANLIADAATDTAALFASNGREMVQALEAALAEYDRSGREPRRRLLVLAALVRCSFLIDPALVRYADPALAALRSATGLALADELRARNGTEPRAAALQAAMVATARRHAELPEDQRGFDVFEAVQHLLLAAFSLMGVGINQLDIAAVQRVEALTAPLSELGASPAATAHRLIVSVIDGMQGRQRSAQAGRDAFIAALADPAAFGTLSEERRRSLLAAQIHGTGMLESLHGGEKPLARAAQLEAMGLRAFEPAAMQIRVLTHLFNGDEARADACRAQLDVLALQRAPAWHLDTWILPYLAGPYELWGDVIGLKQAVDQLRAAAAAAPGYEPFYRYALGAYHRERGQLSRAFTELRTALALAPAGEHVAWSPAIAAYVHTLVRAGDYRDAIAEGERAMDRARADGLAELWVCGRIEPQLALARAHLGDCVDAAARLDAFIATSERDAMPRPMLGKCYEARALVATLAADREAFVAAAHRVGVCYRATNNPKLIAAHERLWQSATATQQWTPDSRSESDIATM